MATIRRLYVYVVAAVTLGIGLAGLTGLVRVILDALLGGSGAIGAPGQLRENLSLAIALTAVGVPLWLAHAWYAERQVAHPGPAGAAERGSAVRSLYLAGAIAIPLLLGATALAELIRAVVGGLIGLDSTAWIDRPSAAASASVLLVTSLAFARLRIRDLAAGPLHGAAARLARLALYGPLVVALVAFLFACASAIETILRLVVGRPPVASSGDWSESALVGALAQGLVGGAVLLLARGYATRVVERDDPVGDEERRSQLRAAAWLVVVLVGSGVVALAWAGAVSTLLDAFVVGGVEPLTAVEDVVAPLISTIPFLAAVAWQRRDARREAAELGGEVRLGSIARLVDLVTAAVGIALLGVGAAWSLGFVVDLTLGGSRTAAVGSGWRRELDQFLSYAIVGLPIWGWAWLSLGRRVALDRGAEVRSSSRRGYLLLVGGASLVATAVALAYVLYRVLRVALGLEVGDLTSDVSGPLGIVVVAGAVLAGHARTILGDVRARAAIAATTPAEAGLARVALVATGPADGDPAAVVARLRAALPDGWHLAEERGEPPGDA